MKILFSIGDINGIGVEVLFKALAQNTQWFDNNEFSILCNAGIIKKLVEKYNFEFCKFIDNCVFIKDSYQINLIDIRNPDVLHIAKEIANDVTEITFGEIALSAGTIAYQSIIEATNLVLAKTFDALITLPVSKAAIHLFNKEFVGHTELLSDLCKEKNPVMILFAENFRVALVTTHIPIYSVSRRITEKRLRTLIKNFNNSLKNDFAIESPKIAVLGLNPHSSDNGMFGKEEEKNILPAIQVMQKKEINVSGCFVADGFFANKYYERFDGVIAMYHDQGLIPLKMIANGGGVNFTANLPIVRTSPDHGTAFEIAGQNIANPQSMIDSINSAIDIVNKRIETPKQNKFVSLIRSVVGKD